MVKRALICLFALPSFLFADQVAVSKFSLLNNNNNSVTIASNQAQDLLNVDLTPGGLSVKKRMGYGTYKALSTGQAVHGGYHAFDSTGNDYQLWGSSKSLYGIVADGTPTQLISSATLNSTWDCADTQGSSYCVDSNRDAYIKTAGASISWYTTPLGTMVEATPDRVIVAGVSGTPNTLYVSQSNTFTNFVTGVLTTDAFTEVIASPGSKLTHIRWGCGKLLWWKDASFGYLDFDNQYSAQIKIISDNIGTFDNTSAIDPGGRVWFRGQDGHTWMYDCSSLTKESIDITPNVQTAGKRTTNSWTQTSQSDWQAGSIVANGPTNSLSTTISVGDVIPSSITVIDNTNTLFGQGTVPSTMDNSSGNVLKLKNYFLDTFPTFSNWTSYATGQFPSNMVASGGTAVCSPTSGNCAASSAQTINGDFIIQFDVIPTSADGALHEYLAINGSNQGYGISVPGTNSGGAIRLVLTSNATDANARTNLCTGGASTTGSHTFALSRNSTTNLFTLYKDGVSLCTATDSTYTSFTKLWIDLYGLGVIGNVVDSARTANFNSRTLDTAFTFPIYGPFTTTPGGTGSFAYAVRCSSNGVDTFTTDAVLTSGTSIPGCAQKRYAVYSATITATSSASSLPQLMTASVIASSTGTFYSAVKNAPNLTAWSTLGVNQVLNSGTETFYMRSSTSSFTVLSSTPAWTSQTVGGLVSISTGTYFQLRDDFFIDSGTQTPTLNDFTVNWFEGSASDQAYMLYFDNAIWESVAFGAGQSTNNYIFKRDLINDGWTLYNFGAGGMLIQSNTLYFGDTTSGNVFNFGTATSDNGAAINAYWKSKDFTGSDPFLQNQLTQIDTFAKKNQGSTLTGTYTTDTSTSTAYSISLSTTNAIVQSRKLFPSGKLGYTFNVKYGDNSASSAWELFGFRIGYLPLTYRPTP